MSVFDSRELDALADDVDDRQFTLTFAATYRRMLPRRIERLRTAIDEQDSDQAMDAVLSLRVASTVVGTHELAAMARYIESLLRQGNAAAAAGAAELLVEAAGRADALLATYLGDPADSY